MSDALEKFKAERDELVDLSFHALPKYQGNKKEHYMFGYKAGFNAALRSSAVRKFVDVVEGISINAAHICPNDSIHPVEQCTLCICLEALDKALANFNEILKGIENE